MPDLVVIGSGFESRSTTPSFWGRHQTPVGSVGKVGAPTTLLGNYKVVLHDQTAGYPVQVMWSGEDGVYQFRDIAAGTYFIVAFDHTGQYGGVIETDVVSEPMP